ncbi:YhgE/Pip domain-containing protein [Corynebacterium variabile]|uniref:YhgE/Pip N-terminal domain/YhgE/Pip C-terminal domain n=4 Tax=Corynebacterium variabile TaxID=1727 RepID=A0A0X2NKG8_9CORY|nr:YhgE/Pip domain-containing protein [Corynebacterium variabile]MDN6661102.1 YhgE/Pip domain-containing protein [Corynebacterium variabile]CUU65954.1 YhgE/Pip N-terminal domain/YhgE/Pip C-terminal domain [Corynebacterium variabile]
MSRITEIVRGDLKAAGRNVMTGIVLFGLVVIPMLFAVFNVLASWDPFSRTDELKIAVASADKGHESDLAPISLNLGDQVLSQLSRNDQIDWVITGTDDAVEGTKSGEYYASIVLPEDFSTSLLTFYTAGTEPTQLELYTNEKKNALSTVLTEQGAEGVITQINDTFAEIIGSVGLGVVSSLDNYLEEDDTKAAIDRIEARVENIGVQLRAGAQTMRSLTGMLDSTAPLLEGAGNIARAAGAQFDDTGSDLGGGADATDSLDSTLRSAAASLEQALSSTADSYSAVGDRLDSLFDSAGNAGTGTAATFTDLAARVQQQTDGFRAVRETLDDTVGAALPAGVQAGYDRALAGLDAAIDRSDDLHDRLTQTAQDITDGTADAQASRQSVQDALDRASSAVDSAVTSYRQDLQPQMTQLGDTLDDLGDSIGTVREDLEGVTASFADSPGSLQETLDRARSATVSIADKLEEHADQFEEMADALSTAGETGDFSKLARAAGDDPQALASQLAAPVAVDREAVFPVASFGAGMTPLYVTLSLWVGALLTAVFVRPRVDGEGETYTRAQAYLGRFGIFALTGLAQATMVALGMIVFVQVGAAHPFLFTLCCWVTSLVFQLIVYTLVLSLGSAGKAVAVLLLVLQVSGGGGAYPLQLLPGWFQVLSPWLPATHAIDAMRAAIAGVYRGDLWIELGILLLFAVPFLVLGLWLRGLLDGYNRTTTEAIEKTKVMA